MSAEKQSAVSRNDWDQWWRQAVIYQVYPRSFADGNGDGIGDLAGVLERFDHLVNLGVDAIWFSPFYPSPGNDGGYDVANYTDINPEYGTLEEFDQVIARAHAAGIKIIIDLVPNHSSWEHEFFRAALQAAPGSPERARYWFVESGDNPPNNWGSIFGGSAWDKVAPLSGKGEDEGWWYLHLFDVSQPDFNWTNPAVHEFFTSVLRFWADRGVDGFRVDVAHGLVKEEGLPDDEIGPDRWGYREEHGTIVERGPFFDQEGIHEIYREWRRVLDEYGPDRMLVAEAYVESPQRLARFLRPGEMSQAFNFDLFVQPWHAQDWRASISAALAANQEVGAPTTWVLSNHDQVRAVSRFGYPAGAQVSGAGVGIDDPQPDNVVGLARTRAAFLFLAGLPGSLYLYQGEELGLPESTQMPDEARLDPTFARTDRRVRGRDGCRVPLPWEGQAVSYGFSSSQKTWLPQPAGWEELAADQQWSDSQSTLAWYRHILAARKQRQLGLGDFAWADEGLAADLSARGLVAEHGDFNRALVARNGKMLVAINMGIRPVRLDIATLSGGQARSARPVALSQAVSADSVDSVESFELAPNAAVWLEL